MVTNLGDLYKINFLIDITLNPRLVALHGTIREQKDGCDAGEDCDIYYDVLCDEFGYFCTKILRCNVPSEWKHGSDP